MSLTDPHSKRHGGTMRTLNLVTVLNELNFPATVKFPQSTDGLSVDAATLKSSLLSRVGLLKRSYLPMPTSTGGRSRRLRQEVRDLDPRLVVVTALSQLSFADATRSHMWLDFMDVWSDFAAVEALQRRGLQRVTANLQATQLRRRENYAAKSALVVTAAGWSDSNNLNSRGIRAIWLPTALADSEFKRARSSPFDHRRTFGFIGNFDYWPNVDAYERLVTAWAPRLSSAGHRVVVAGLSSDRLALRSESVEILGPVDNVDSFYGRVDVSLAPITLGGGMKVKVVESLSRGVPVIGTKEAFAGLPPTLNAFLHEVDAGGRGLDSIPEIPSPDPADICLTPFRMSSMKRTVRDELAPLLALSMREE